MFTMSTIADQIYPEDYRCIEALIIAIEQGKQLEAAQRLAELEAHVSHIQSLPRRLQSELFLNAIKCRLEQTKAENLYLVKDDGQQIKMFNFMAGHFPVVQAAQKIANTVFVSSVGNSQHVVILDIGIGSGMQMANFIQQALNQCPHLSSFSVLGIEPSADSLVRAEGRLDDLTRELKVPISFTGFAKTMEELDSADWEIIQSQVNLNKGTFLVNASFALHHIRPLAFRNTLFGKLKALSPKAFMMIEPYADYTSDSLLSRFKNAWHHYGLTFRALDTIPENEDDKNTLKQVFFGREMIDVLAEEGRIEQFEPAEKWADRLHQAGFETRRIDNLPHSEKINPLIQIEEGQGYIRFNVSGCPIVAILYAV